MQLVQQPRKPSFLYHASPRRNITIFEQRAESIRDPLEGPVVFATPDKAYASMFMVPTNDSWVVLGRFSTKAGIEPWHIVISDREKFMRADQGGAIYRFSSDLFTTDPGRNMSGMEWTSKTAVMPIDKEEYGSGLQAMKELGILVYFIDARTFEAITAANDQGHLIISQLRPD